MTRMCPNNSSIAMSPLSLRGFILDNRNARRVAWLHILGNSSGL